MFLRDVSAKQVAQLIDANVKETDAYVDLDVNALTASTLMLEMRRHGMKK